MMLHKSPQVMRLWRENERARRLLEPHLGKAIEEFKEAPEIRNYGNALYLFNFAHQVAGTLEGLTGEERRELHRGNPASVGSYSHFLKCAGQLRRNALHAEAWLTLANHLDGKATEEEALRAFTSEPGGSITRTGGGWTVVKYNIRTGKGVESRTVQLAGKADANARFKKQVTAVSGNYLAALQFLARGLDPGFEVRRRKKTGSEPKTAPGYAEETLESVRKMAREGRGRSVLSFLERQPDDRLEELASDPTLGTHAAAVLGSKRLAERVRTGLRQSLHETVRQLLDLPEKEFAAIRLGATGEAKLLNAVRTARVIGTGRGRTSHHTLGEEGIKALKIVRDAMAEEDARRPGLGELIEKAKAYREAKAGK